MTIDSRPSTKTGYLYCGKVKVMIFDGDHGSMVEAHRYMSVDDQTDLIVYAHALKGKVRRRLDLEHGGEITPSPARCDEILQPLDSTQEIGDPVMSRICDPLAKDGSGTSIYTCKHGTGGKALHVWPGGVEDCRAALGWQICECGSDNQDVLLITDDSDKVVEDEEVDP